MYEKPTETPETQLDIGESLRQLGQRIDALVTNEGVTWLFEKTRKMEDGTVAMLVHRMTGAENDYWVRHLTDTGLSVNNLRGKPYEEWRWDYESPGNKSKQLVLILDTTRSAKPYIVKRGFNADDISAIESKIASFEAAEDIEVKAS